MRIRRAQISRGSPYYHAGKDNLYCESSELSSQLSPPLYALVTSKKMNMTLNHHFSSYCGPPFLDSRGILLGHRLPPPLLCSTLTTPCSSRPHPPSTANSESKAPTGCHLIHSAQHCILTSGTHGRKSPLLACLLLGLSTPSHSNKAHPFPLQILGPPAQQTRPLNRPNCY